jgi:hypothetical protein
MKLNPHPGAMDKIELEERCAITAMLLTEQRLQLCGTPSPLWKLMD